MLYGIYHGYHVDGGYGDAIWNCKLICYCRDEETAKKFVRKYSNRHVYDTPYADLYCGELYYEELYPELTEENFKKFKWKKRSKWDPDDLCLED